MFVQTLAKLKTSIANIITLSNLSLGFIAIIAIFQDNIKLAMVFILLAAFTDRLDGVIARKLNITSELGEHLDSLCDLVSFGVAPALLIYSTSLSNIGFAGIICPLFYLMCGAYRLARFNVSTNRSYFTGVPIPVAACLMTMLTLFSENTTVIFELTSVYIISILMVSSLKIRKI